MKKVKLTYGKYALIDDEDYPIVSLFKWRLHNAGYAITNVRITTNNVYQLLMHRLINNTSKDMETDHINHNRLDNRKDNLRSCSHQQNTMNTKQYKNKSSKYKGVCWHKPSKSWHTYITKNKIYFCLGYYKNETEAAKAYDKKAPELFGEFANLNLPS